MCKPTPCDFDPNYGILDGDFDYDEPEDFEDDYWYVEDEEDFFDYYKWS